MRIKKGEEEKDVAREFSPSPCRPNLFITEDERGREWGETKRRWGIKSYVIGNAICGAHNVAFMRWCTHRRA